jgi:hypothetical protein
VADVKGTKLSQLVFTTSSKDYHAYVSPPTEPTTEVIAGAPLPTDEVGLYELIVRDNGGKALSVTLSGGQPPDVKRDSDDHVHMTYQILY